MNDLLKSLGNVYMWEKIAAGLVLAMVGAIQVGFWRLISSMSARICKNEETIAELHERITKQADSNNEKFARRDDMKDMEDRLVNAMNAGFNGLKQDIRSIGK